MVRTRRRLLAGLGAIGIAGLSTALQRTGRSDVGNEPTTTTQSTTSISTTTQTTTADADDPDPLYSGETIPPTTHPSSRSTPSAAGPIPGGENPILTAADVTDFGDVTYVADPFLFIEEDEWHLFFEVYNENRDDPDAVIGYTHSTDGREWEYDGVVLSKEYHTSFPLIWKWEGDYYTCPPSTRAVELWKATSFPHEWTFLDNVVEVDYYPHDPTFLRHDDRWWIVTDRGYEDVMVYHSETLESNDWTPHSQNPVVTERREAARPGGRPVVVGETPYLFFQDLSHEYGDKIRGYEVVELSTGRYRDREIPESPVLSESGIGWNADGMHTFDPWWVGDGWVCAVDGKVAGDWSIGLFHVPADLGVEPARIPHDRALTEGYYESESHRHVIADHSGGDCAGAVYGATTEERDGICGLRFESSDDRVVISHPHETPLGSDAVSLVTYAQPATDGHVTLLDYGHPDGDRHLRVERPGGGTWHVSAAGSEGTVSFDVGAPGVSRPTQVALTHGTDGLSLWIGGTRRGGGETPGDVTDPLSYAVVGADRPGAAPWDGWVGPVGLFSVALSARELATIDERLRT